MLSLFPKPTRTILSAALFGMGFLGCTPDEPEPDPENKDLDGDGYDYDAGDCNDEDPSIYPGAEDTWYDGIDSDCAEDNDFDADQDGYESSDHGGTDCDDNNASVNPDGTHSIFQDGDCSGEWSNVLDQSDFAVFGENAGDWAGVSLTGTGDVDGDGLGDFLIGARYNGQAGEKAGKVYFVSGGGVVEGEERSLAQADQQFVGEFANDWLGYSVGPGGDVNGDGLQDLLMASVWNDEAAEDAGKVYLVFGGFDSTQTDVGQLADHSFLGQAPSDGLGISMHTAGDVDGDGLSDILIGSHHNDQNGDDAGQAYLVLAKSLESREPMDIGQADFRFLGDQPGDEAGRFVAGINDVDGDGFDDILVASPWADHAGEGTGTVYLIRGSSLTDPGIHSVNDANMIFYGEAPEDFAGHSVLGAGDVDADGLADFMVGSMYNDDGANNGGKAYLLLGASLQEDGEMSLSESDYAFLGEEDDDVAGRMVAGVGDLDADGRDDILVGAFANSESATVAGKTYIVMGSSLVGSTTMDLSEADYSFLGEAPQDKSGQTASGLGDVNGDGLGDLLIGAYRNDEAGVDSGKNYVIFSRL